MFLIFKELNKFERKKNTPMTLMLTMHNGTNMIKKCAKLISTYLKNWLSDII